MKTDVNSYFAVSSRQAVQDLVTSMKNEYGRTGSQAATDLGFEILDKIAVQHHALKATDGTQPAGTPADGSRLANDVIACMSELDPMPTAAIDFAKLVDGSYTGALGDQGAFEVRGAADSPNDDEAMYTYDRKSVISPPSDGFSDWTGGDELLFYASRISNGFLTETPVKSTGFSWNTVPVRHTFNGLATFGMCVFSGTTTTAVAKDRIQEIGVDDAGSDVARVLAEAPSGLTCGTESVMAPSGIFGRIVNLARALILPQAAYAGQLGGGTGGLLGGLTDLGVVVSSATTLSFGPITDGRISGDMPEFTVTAKTANGSTFAGMTITLSVVGNVGSFTVYQDGVIQPNPTAVTDVNGVAHFDNVKIDKAGGYTFGATGADGGSDDGADNEDFEYTAPLVNSKMFHIKR